MIPTRMLATLPAPSGGWNRAVHGRVTECAEMTDRHQRCRHGKEAGVRQDGVAYLQLRFAKVPALQAHGQFPDATADQHASQHDLRHRGEAIRSEADALERVASVGPEQARERV